MKYNIYELIDILHRTRVILSNYFKNILISVIYIHMILNTNF